MAWRTSLEIGCVVMRAVGEAKLHRIIWRCGPWFQYACLWNISWNFSLKFLALGMEFASCYQSWNVENENKTACARYWIKACAHTYTEPLCSLANSTLLQYIHIHSSFYAKPHFSASVWFDSFSKNTWNDFESI